MAAPVPFWAKAEGAALWFVFWAFVPAAGIVAAIAAVYAAKSPVEERIEIDSEWIDVHKRAYGSGWWLERRPLREVIGVQIAMPMMAGHQSAESSSMAPGTRGVLVLTRQVALLIAQGEEKAKQRWLAQWLEREIGSRTGRLVD